METIKKLTQDDIAPDITLHNGSKAALLIKQGKDLITTNIQGNINLKCGDEKCGGNVIIKNKKQDEQVHS